MRIPDSLVETGIALNDQYFDVRGLSVYSSLSRVMIYYHIRNTELPHFKIGGKFLIKKSEFDQWVEAIRRQQELDLDEIVNEVMENFNAKK